MYLRYIHFCLQQKYEISAVDCTQIKDLDNLCVRPTIDYLQAIVFLKEILKYFLCIFDTFTFAKAKVWDLSTPFHFGRDDV